MTLKQFLKENPQVAIVCADEEEIKSLLQQLDSLNYVWTSGGRLTENLLVTLLGDLFIINSSLSDAEGPLGTVSNFDKSPFHLEHCPAILFSELPFILKK